MKMTRMVRTGKLPNVIKKTMYQPPKGRVKELDLFCDTIQTLTHNHDSHTIPTQKHNLTHEQKKALRELDVLVKDRVVRISTADKGGAMVVQDVSSYVDEANRQLTNPLHYVTVEEDPTRKIAKQANDIVEHLKRDNLIDKNTYNWALLDTDTVRPHTFYHVPKIHKDALNPPGRPIVSGIGGPTEKLSKLVDSWLREIVEGLPSYVKDSTHFLKTIQEWNLKGPFLEAHLVTLDVVGLYTNIPHNDIDEAIRAVLDQSDMATHSPPTKTIIDIVNFVLLNNFFCFEGQTYKQIYGTAMGTPMAPTVANLFMGWLEKKLLANSPVDVHPQWWKRFIDDIFLLWLHPISQLEEFKSYINQLHPTIKFTITSSSVKLPFLDIMVSLENGFLTTDLYTKHTDAHAYLHYSSCHPSHCKNSIPHSQFLRLRRLCSSNNRFDKQARQMELNLLKRGYPKKLIQKSKYTAKQTSRESALTYKHKAKQTRVPFIITHNPRNPPLKTWHNTQFEILQANERLKKAIPEVPIIGERKCRSLRDILMPSTLPIVKDQTPPGCFVCDKQCIICKQHFTPNKTFQSDQTGETFTIREKLTCTSTGIIYLLFCSKCRCSQYVGETKNSLKTRFYLHRSNINTNTGTLITRHFNQPDHSLANLRCIIIEKVFNNTLAQRLKRENFWIKKLKTISPFGLNSQELQ
eukprot:TRINITY_DN2026_c0_g1_i5.p1 TRINITY_DN2026_c0_g1~~TRINITY_DN2026_c0_g1_i5.p1  ORF type:complete len:690 (-),score=105.99 TRINITY_DN2026_c0_g1_i5:520-2589(-)